MVCFKYNVRTIIIYTAKLKKTNHNTILSKKSGGVIYPRTAKGKTKGQIDLERKTNETHIMKLLIDA